MCMRPQKIKMKCFSCMFLHGVVCLLPLLFSAAFIHAGLVRNSRSVPEPVNCQWGPYGSWSDCDGCSKTQTQIRSIAVYPQFNGRPCTGSPNRVQTCSSARVCPLKEGCGGRFRCQSGKCISQSLICNGDQDCEEDGLDENQKCGGINLCDLQKPPPNVELTGQGYDAVSKQVRGTVINTKSFGGLCRKTFSGDHMDMFRVPQSVIRYTFQVTAKNDNSEETYQSSWHYLHQIERHGKTTGTDYGHDHYSFHDELLKTKSNHLVIIKSDVEVAQFQNQSPEYLPISEEFWKALLSLPVAYNYAAYRNVLERFGTHYMSEGTLGGQLRVFLSITNDMLKTLKKEKKDYYHCVVTHHSILFFIRWSTKHCEEDSYDRNNPFYQEIPKRVTSIDIIGGHTAHIAKLLMLNESTLQENGRAFSMWSGSVKDFPKVINQKLRPLHELVKEVSCAGLKKHHLKRAIETYLIEKHPCQCRECQNNGLRVIIDDVCKCVCKPGTEGKACELGTPLDEQPGVIHGDWACWSPWSTCKQDRKIRTRSCSRPAPRGGKDCIGKAEETTTCDDDEDLEHLRIMEPHCFDESLTPKESCKTPPFLTNGFVLYPKDVYLVGSKIEYTCIEGYYLIGEAIAECQENLKWTQYPRQCKRTVCDPPKLSSDLTGSPWKVSYKIGEAIALSCPEGKKIEGPAEIQCNAGLVWSPQLKNTRCQTVSVKPAPTIQCQPWENLAKDKCVCKVPHECKSSLDICATHVKRGQTQRLSLCKIQAMRCLGQEYTLAEDSACQWPVRSSANCPHCTLWENCDEQTNTCGCKTVEECSSLKVWIPVCAQLEGASAPVTMTECEAGVRKCRGETVRIVSVQSCQS